MLPQFVNGFQLAKPGRIPGDEIFYRRLTTARVGDGSKVGVWKIFGNHAVRRIGDSGVSSSLVVIAVHPQGVVDLGCCLRCSAWIRRDQYGPQG